MIHHRISIPTMTVFIILCVALSACGPKSTETPVSSEPSGTILTLVAPNGGHVFNMSQLKSPPGYRRTGWH